MLAERMTGPGLDAPVNIKSVSKTIVASLAGAALDRAVIPSVDAALGDVAPRLVPEGGDPRVDKEASLASKHGVERTSSGSTAQHITAHHITAQHSTAPQ